MTELTIIAGLTAIIYLVLTVLRNARDRKDKIKWQQDKAFLDEIDKRNGN